MKSEKLMALLAIWLSLGSSYTDKKAVKSPDNSTSKDKQKKKHSTTVKKSSTYAKLEAMD